MENNRSAARCRLTEGLPAHRSHAGVSGTIACRKRDYLAPGSPGVFSCAMKLTFVNPTPRIAGLSKCVAKQLADRYRDHSAEHRSPANAIPDYSQRVDKGTGSSPQIGNATRVGSIGEVPVPVSTDHQRAPFTKGDRHRDAACNSASMLTLTRSQSPFVNSRMNNLGHIQIATTAGAFRGHHCSSRIATSAITGK